MKTKIVPASELDKGLKAGDYIREPGKFTTRSHKHGGKNV